LCHYKPLKPATMKISDLKKGQLVSFKKQETHEFIIQNIVRNNFEKSALIFATTKDGFCSVVRRDSSIVKVDRKWVERIDF